MKTEHKEYPQQPFSVEPTKLTKLLKTIHDKLEGGTATEDRFLVYMRGDRKAEFSNVDDVLGLDNSRKKRIERLIIRSFRTEATPTGPRREVEVDFGVPRKKDGAVQRGVAIQVSGDTSTWVSDALSDVEQQVERTWTRSGPPVLIAASIVLVCLVSILLVVFPIRIPTSPTGNLAVTMWLTPPQIDEYTSKLSGGPISAEDALALTTHQLTNLSLALTQEKEQPHYSTPSVLTTFVPLVVVVSLGFFIIIVCYPPVVFLWGDEKDRQIWRDSSKRYLWPLLLAITFVPIVSRLFLSGVLPGLAR